MPRRKVPLHDRQRAVQACQQCRSSKKRCNGEQPCTGCTRKGRARSCTFTDGQSSPTPRRTVAQPDMDDGGYSDRVSSAEPEDQSMSGQNVVNMISPSGNTIPLGSPTASHKTQARLLDSTQGQKVFIGGSASLSFLQLIRDVVSQNLGKSDFSNHANQNQMLEAPQTNAVPIDTLVLDQQQHSVLVDLCFTASCGLLEFWDRDEVMTNLKQQGISTHAQTLSSWAIPRVIVAIGAQCATRSDFSTSISQFYFAEAQKHAFAGMIQHPSLEIVQIFLLMAFYMMGACQRNSAYMYIGVAARAAFVLGMHHDIEEQKSQEILLERSRKDTWKSLVVLDVVVSSILGRPSAVATHSKATQNRLSFHNGAAQSHRMALDANYRLACLLDQKVQKLYIVDKATGKGARSCLDWLQKWSRSLPKELRRASMSQTTSSAQDHIIGGLQVSCFYYFAVMLISRPFLILHLTNRLAMTQNGDKGTSESVAEDSGKAEVEEFASACLSAATFMIQTCLETKTRGFLPDEMRLLKPWLFAAGLVLGFDMFTVRKSESEIEEAFQGSCDLLKYLSDKSPQAAHYYDILLSLKDAVTARRQKVQSDSVRRTQNVEKLLAFEDEWPSPDIVENMSTDNSEITPAMPLSFDNSHDHQWSEGAIVDLDFEVLMNEPFLNWGSTDFLSWDQVG